MGYTRREWLAGVSVAAGSALTAGCGTEDLRPGARPSPEASGASSGGFEDPYTPAEVALDAGVPDFSVDPIGAFEVGPDRAIVWAYASQQTVARVELQDAGGAPLLETEPFALFGESGRTGRVQLTGLAPAQRYRYRVRYETGVDSPWAEFRTAPAPDADVEARFVVSADIGNNPLRVSPIFWSMCQSDAAFFVCLGDWPYTDANPAATTLDEYRVKHQRGRRAERVRQLLRRMSARAIYDDHDVECNWDEAFRDSQPERLQAALTAWDEWFPRSSPERYQRWRWGRHLELFLLDTRLYRSANGAPDDAAKTILGAEQKAWLMSGLAASDASFKLLLSSVPFDYATGGDGWQGFSTERDELFDFIRDSGISGVVLVSADRHYLSVNHYPNGLREYQVGPLAAGTGTPPAPQPGVMVQASTLNYGEISVSSGADPELTFTGRDSNGEALYSETTAPYVLV